MTDTTAARRALLNLLLDRVDRDALLEPEKPLLRCLVAAEQGAADTRPTTDDDARPWIADALGLDIETSWGVIADSARSHLHHLAAANDALARVRELHRQANNGETCVYCAPLQRLGYDTTWPCDTVAALDAPAATPDDAQPAPKARHWRGTDGTDITTAYMDAQATLARVRALADSLESFTGAAHPDDEISRGLAAQWIRTALECPSPAPDDAQAAADRAVLDNAIADDIARRAVEGGNTGQMIGLVGLGVATPVVTDDASDVEIIAANDIPTDWANGFDSRCSARYTGPPPGIDVKWGARSDYQCDLRVHSRGTDHAARLGSGPFSWTDDIAVWPTDNAPSEPQP